MGASVHPPAGRGSSGDRGSRTEVVSDCALASLGLDCGGGRNPSFDGCGEELLVGLFVIVGVVLLVLFGWPLLVLLVDVTCLVGALIIGVVARCCLAVRGGSKRSTVLGWLVWEVVDFLPPDDAVTTAPRTLYRVGGRRPSRSLTRPSTP
jgi:hypothetical protein